MTLRSGAAHKRLFAWGTLVTLAVAGALLWGAELAGPSISLAPVDAFPEIDFPQGDTQSAELPAGRQEATQSSALLEIKVTSLPTGARARIICQQTQRKGVSLWERDVTESAPKSLLEIPADTDLRISLVPSLAVPFIVHDVRAGPGEVVAVHFDLSRYCRQIIRLQGVPDEYLSAASLTLEYISPHVQAGLGATRIQQLGGKSEVEHVCDPGRLFHARLESLPCIHLVADNGTELHMTAPGLLILRPDKDLAFIEAHLNGIPARPLFGQVDGKLVYSESGLIVAALNDISAGDCVMNMRGAYAPIDKAQVRAGCKTSIGLREPDGGVEIVCPGGTGLSISLFGPDDPIEPTSQWHTLDPRFQVRKFTGDTVRFEGLPPGTYTLRWQASDGARSPVVSRVLVLGGDTTRLALDRSGARRVKYRVSGIGPIANHLGRPFAQLVVWLDGQSMQLAPGDDPSWELDGWGSLRRLSIRIDDDRVTGPLDALVVNEQSGTCNLRLNDSVVLWHIVLVGNSQSIRLGRNASFGSLQAGPRIPMVSPGSSSVLLPIWLDGDYIRFHGAVKIAAGELGGDRTIITDGREIRLSVRGDEERCTLEAESEGEIFRLGYIAAPREPFEYKVWTSQYTQALRVSIPRGGTQRIPLPAFDDILPIDVARK